MPPSPLSEVSGPASRGLFLLVRAASLPASWDRTMPVLIYVDTSKQVGDPDHLNVFANADVAEAWFTNNDPEGVAFEYEVTGAE